MTADSNPFAAALASFGVEARPEPAEASAAKVPSSFADPAAALLAGLGVSTVDTRRGVIDTVNDVLAANGAAAEATGLRWKTLTIEASPAQAKFLRYETDRILDTLRASFGDEVAAVRVLVRRRTPGQRGDDAGRGDER
jgi:phosphoglycolate phosphatase-like HAD superfamily hydrolase